LNCPPWPECALNPHGEQTTDPAQVLQGVLLPFGGHKGSAIALIVEMLAGGAIGETFSYEAGEANNKDGGPPRGATLFAGNLGRSVSRERLGESLRGILSSLRRD
jgi:LDH2 family malate/lactate/ureidoglycolate dehydrogenase